MGLDYHISSRAELPVVDSNCDCLESKPEVIA